MVLVSGYTCSIEAQNTKPEVSEITVCELAKNPEKYRGKIVIIEANASNDKHGTYLYHHDCPTKEVIMNFPYVVTPKPPFDLQVDSSFKEFMNALHRPVLLDAKFEGRFDTNYIFENGKKKRLIKGYGNNKKHSMRLVLKRVFKVRAIRLFRK
jgi:hypothetical protein